jgi:pseudaminic acid synthase
MDETSVVQRLTKDGQPAFIIAEISANHDQEFSTAEALIKAAKESGADAVKAQTYTPDTLTINEKSDYFRLGSESLWAGRTLYELYEEAYMPWDWQPRLQEFAEKLGLIFFSTAYDLTSVEFLDDLNIPLYKIASFELVDLPLIEKVASTGRPTIISTGMATLAEIEEAVRVFREISKAPLALLKCTSAYPAPPDEMNLRTIPHLRETFKCPVGLSDHTLGIAVPVAAIALGANIIEKHFTLSRDNPGPDSAFSLEPFEFKEMVDAIRTTESALGQIQYHATAREEDNRKLRRSLFVVEDITEGEIFTTTNVRAIRPAAGLHPRYLAKILGRKASVPIRRGTPLSWNFVS